MISKLFLMTKWDNGRLSHPSQYCWGVREPPPVFTTTNTFPVTLNVLPLCPFCLLSYLTICWRCLASFCTLLLTASFNVILTSVLLGPEDPSNQSHRNSTADMSLSDTYQLHGWCNVVDTVIGQSGLTILLILKWLPWMLHRKIRNSNSKALVSDIVR